LLVATPPVAARAAAPALAVYPTAGSRTASPTTSISLRGLAPGKIGDVVVTGSRSGDHRGAVRADSDGNGESFFPDRPFVPGEQVTVALDHQLVGSPAGRVTFTVSRPVTDPTASSTESDDPAGETHFRSEPDLHAPIVHVTKGSLDPSAGSLFLAPRGGSGDDGPEIVEPDGSLVWFQPVSGQLRAEDFRVQTYRGRPVLTWYVGRPSHGHGQGSDVVADSTYATIAEVRAGNGYRADHHEFQLTRWGTALITAYQPVHWDLRGIGGPADGIVYDGIFQEIDIPTGNVLAEWHSLDHVDLADSYVTLHPDRKFDYFHINSLDARTPGSVLVSSRNTHTILYVDEATGRVLWRLGGKHSSFTGAGADLSSQHDAHFVTADDVSVFDNGAGAGPALRSYSRAVVVHLDLAARTATLITADDGTFLPVAGSDGSTQVLPSGDVFVSWGAQHTASEFDRRGREIYRSVLPDSDWTYREFRFVWHGSPTTRPAVAASVAGSAASTVWASWNGATEVASWRVLTGSAPANVSTPAGVHARAGFETAMRLAGRPGYVRVQALAADGSVLATSRVTAVRR
jgi:hypothetical protein